MASQVQFVNGTSHSFDGFENHHHVGNGDVSDSDIVLHSPVDSTETTPIPSPKVGSTTERIKRKAKRPSKALGAFKPTDNGVSNGHTVSNGVQFRYRKNSRRPRNGYSRGLPKKGGAGGKGVWGKPGSELGVEEEDINDVHDPNYESDKEDNVALESITPELPEEDFEKNVQPILLEYFEHGDSSEVALSLDELNLGKLRPHLVVMVVSLAMERKPSHRELTSVLLSDLYGHILLESDYAKGFGMLLTSLCDLVLDTPDAPIILGNFIARAVADDCLPPKFVHNEMDKGATTEHITSSLSHANTWLSMKHGLVRLDNVWGVGGGMRPVKHLVIKIQLLLQEYLSSGDMAEATRCLQELEVPHFHHELVYEAIVMVIESMDERAMESMCKLLKSLAASAVVTPDQMKQGFERVYDELSDISIDVPPAYSLMEKFVNMCHANGFLSQYLVKNMPTRGRKRFVSEGDGGLIKESY